MDQIKPWYLSKGVIGPIIAMLSLLAGYLFGVKVDEATQAVLVDQIVATLATLFGLGGSALGIYGRIVATSRIK